MPSDGITPISCNDLIGLWAMARPASRAQSTVEGYSGALALPDDGMQMSARVCMLLIRRTLFHFPDEAATGPRPCFWAGLPRMATLSQKGAGTVQFRTENGPVLYRFQKRLNG